VSSPGGYSWRVPENVSGQFRVVVAPNLGPIKWEPEPEAEATHTIPN
jgi:hypothetical protein